MPLWVSHGRVLHVAAFFRWAHRVWSHGFAARGGFLGRDMSFRIVAFWEKSAQVPSHGTWLKFLMFVRRQQGIFTRIFLPLPCRRRIRQEKLGQTERTIQNSKSQIPPNDTCPHQKIKPPKKRSQPKQPAQRRTKPIPQKINPTQRKLKNPNPQNLSR